MKLSESLKNCFHNYLFRAMKEDAKTLVALAEYPLDDQFIDFDAYVRNCLQQGQCELESHTLSLWYAYTYMLMHSGAFQLALNNSKMLSSLPKDLRNVLVIDFGCGPLTCALALSEWNFGRRRPPVNFAYFGIDRSSDIQKVGLDLTHEYEHFGENYKSYIYDNWNKITANEMKKLISVDGSVLFCFSYFFGQESVGADTVQSVAHTVHNVLAQVEHKSAFIIYTNAPGRDDRYMLFKSELGLPNSAPVRSSYECHFPRRLSSFQAATMRDRLTYEVLEIT